MIQTLYRNWRFLFGLEVDTSMRKLSGLGFQLFRSVVYRALSNTFVGFELIAESYWAFVPKTRTSHPLSKMLWPALQHKRLRTLLGANLAGMMIVATSVSAAPGVLETYPEAEVPVVAEQAVVLTTEQRFVAPVQTIGVSQGFSRFHRGIDIRSGYGTSVQAIASGRVVETVYSRFGYGHYVLVEHEGGYASLYAHLDQILVKPGDAVTQEATLGTVGTTGWSTGSHLHIEIYENGVPVDPRQILSV